MLVLAGEPAEAAAALAGEPLRLVRPRVVGVRLFRELPAGVGGAEILAALAGALAGEGRDALIEYHGESVAALPFAERVAMATLGGAMLGASGSLFPSDEVTRARLAGRGRDADWRRIEGGGEGFDFTLAFDLSRVRTGTLDLSRVRIGALAEDDDLVLLAAAAARERRSSAGRWSWADAPRAPRSRPGTCSPCSRRLARA